MKVFILQQEHPLLFKSGDIQEAIAPSAGFFESVPLSSAGWRKSRIQHRLSLESYPDHGYYDFPEGSQSYPG
jgi:hypothetical protein